MKNTDSFFQTIYRAFSDVSILSREGKKHIALIGGGMSAEREISLASSKAVGRALIELGYKVTFIDMGADIAIILHKIKPDLVFNALHGTYGEDGDLAGLLNIMRIPYTHSGLTSSGVAFDKAKTKDFFVAHNILTAPYKVVDIKEQIKHDPMPRPYVIKPISQGSSIGVELIFPEDKFSFADYKFPYGSKILVEKYIKGREMQVPILNSKALGVLELKILQGRFYDYKAKYTEGLASHIFPAQISQYVMNDLITSAEKIFRLMDCKSVARVEFIYQEEEEKLYAIEINTHPGFTNTSILPEVAEKIGISFNRLVEFIIDSASYE